jgi:4-hydroxythreonine-4-phosphate dehydrogenase
VTKRSSKHASDLLAVTAGEPAGIGPELCLALADYEWSERIVVIGDPDMLAERAASLGLSVAIREYAAGRDIRSAGRSAVRPIPATLRACWTVCAAASTAACPESLAHW